MTEQEWLECDDPDLMLKYLRRKVSSRKLRLFAIACLRRIYQYLPNDQFRNAVDIAERHADGIASDEQLQAAEADTEFSAWHRNPQLPDAVYAYSQEAMDQLSHVDPYESAYGVSNQAASSKSASRAGDRASEFAIHSCFLRDIFGNPFQPVSVDPGWLTTTVVSLAQAIYDERAFDRLPILADALEEAGCDNADILNHCRQPGEHVRGCWVLDQILAKE